jgi:HSP20 family protein
MSINISDLAVGLGTEGGDEMVLRAMNPQYPIQQLRREMDRLWSSFAGDGVEPPWTGLVRGQPAVNVWETSEAVFAELEVPGLKNDQLDVSVVGDQLGIKVERPDAAAEGVTYHRRERPVGSFTRVLRLPAPVASDAVQAELKNGVLTIKLPKAEAARPRKIQVQSK